MPSAFAVVNVNFLVIIHKVLFSNLLPVYSKGVIKSVMCSHLLSIFFIYFYDFTQNIKKKELFQVDIKGKGVQSNITDKSRAQLQKF